MANILRRALQRQHAAANLVFLDRFEQRLEIAFAESVVTLAPDYLRKAVLRDLKSLSDIVNHVLMPHQSVAHVRSSIMLDRLKKSSRLPLRA